ncbi:MAG: hypothetical protein C6W57_09200 [Caldibacillus debilis]|nr:MAG: hypothetical protein BAA03_12450 [Caldibacillus debilis]REJ16275.1 MAG: hypothetical protein C6W57_09200 [Caldibacillus debilis]
MIIPEASGKTRPAIINESIYIPDHKFKKIAQETAALPHPTGEGLRMKLGPIRIPGFKGFFTNIRKGRILWISTEDIQGFRPFSEEKSSA